MNVKQFEFHIHPREETREMTANTLLPVEGARGGTRVCYRGNNLERKCDRKMAEACLVGKIRADDKCISVPGARAIISPQGLFAWGGWLPTGTPVVVELFDGQHELTMIGIVSKSDTDSGTAIEFKEMTESMSRRLVALLVA